MAHTQQPTTSKNGSFFSLQCCMVVVWIVAIVFGELLAFHYVHLWWDPNCSAASSTTRRQGASTSSINAVAAQMLIVADPQLTDQYSYKFFRQYPILLPILSFYCDHYMRKNYKILQRNFPIAKHTLFLGDIFDGGRLMPNFMFNSSVSRFYNVFPQPQQQKQSQEPPPHQYYFALGNHDFLIAESEVSYLVQRFTRHFPPHKANYHFTLGNVDFLVLNSVIMDSRVYNPQLPEHRAAWQYAQVVANNRRATGTKHKLIVVSHVPLFRLPSAGCGPKYQSWRSHQLKMGFGPGYQNMLFPETTEELLQLLEPELVLSGDDHENCEVEHRYFRLQQGEVSQQVNTASEVTIGTFSFLQGSYYPSVGILTVFNKTTSRSSEDNDDNVYYDLKICVLPPQKFIYMGYAVLGLISIVLLILIPSLQCIIGTCAHVRAAKAKKNETGEKEQQAASSSALQPKSSSSCLGFWYVAVKSNTGKYYKPLVVVIVTIAITYLPTLLL